MDETVKAVVITGDDRVSSAGADLHYVEGLLSDWPRYVEFARRFNKVLSSIESQPVPTIALVRGYALAGGL